MNKLLMTAVCAAAGLGALADAEVASANAVGVLDVGVVAGREQLVAVPFEGYGGGDVTVADIVKTSGLGEGSVLTAVSRSGSKVNSWRLNGGRWVAATQVTVSNDGKSSETQGDSPATTTISRGDAFWLKPETTGGTAYVLGAQPTSGSVTVPAGAGWNIVGNPNAGAAADIAMAVRSPAQGDEIVVSENGSEKRYAYIDGMGGWCHRVKGEITKVDGIGLAVGEGCWVNLKTAQDVVFGGKD